MIWIAIYMKYGNNEVFDKPSLYDSNLINIKGDQLASLKVKYSLRYEKYSAPTIMFVISESH